MRNLARHGVRVAPRVCDPQVAVALLQPGEPAAPTLTQLVRYMVVTLPLHYRYITATLPLHYRQ